MTAGVALVNDSFQRLQELNDRVWDVTITDPPYSEHCQANLCSGSLVGTKQVPKYELSFNPLTEYVWLTDLVRVTKRWCLVFCTLEDFGRFEMAVGRPTYVRSGIWYKPNAMGQLTKDRPAAAYEGIAILHAPTVRKQWNGRGSFAMWKADEAPEETIWECNGTRGKRGRHPNEKPIGLCMKLVGLFSNSGETVFDPFCGSGAIGEACARLGRDYVGWDKDESWVEKAEHRLACVEYDMSVNGQEKIDIDRLCRMKT